MRCLMCVLSLGALVLNTPLPLFAESQKNFAELVYQSLDSLSTEVKQLRDQNRMILENQAKILKELDNIKIRVRRG